MGKKNEFLEGLKIGFGIPKKGNMYITLDEWCGNIDELKDAVIKYLSKEGKNCEYIETIGGKAFLLIDNKKYSLSLSTYGSVNSLIPAQTAVLNPV